MDYNIPIYLDIDLLLDLLASIEDGFKIANKITTSESDEKNSKQKGTIGFLSGQLINLGLGTSKEESSLSKNTSEITKYYTYGSMMNKLLDKLHNKELIKKLNDDKSWNNLELYDFVEIQGKFKPNPLSDSFKKFYYMMDLIVKLTPSINPNEIRDLKELKNIKEVIKYFCDALEKENSQKYIVEINSELNCILNLFNEYIQDNSGLELPYGNFKVLGKVIKKADNKEFNLLEGTTAGMSEELINILIDATKSLNTIINLSEIKTTVDGRCIQIIPIAIFV